MAPDCKWLVHVPFLSFPCVTQPFSNLDLSISWVTLSCVSWHAEVRPPGVQKHQCTYDLQARRRPNKQNTLIRRPLLLLLSHDSHTLAHDSSSRYLDHSDSKNEKTDAQIMSSDFSPTGSSSSKNGSHFHNGNRQHAASDANIRNFAPVARIMKTALPDNAKIAKEAKECMQECVSEFISFITSEGKSDTRGLQNGRLLM